MGEAAIGGWIAAVIGSSLLLLMWWMWREQGRKVKGLPPGSMGWPMLGETLEFYFALSSTQPNKFFEKRCLRYGRLFKTNLFLTPMIVSTDPQVNKFIFSNEDKLFKCSYPASVNSMFGENSLFRIYGDLHKRLHGMIARNLSAEKLRETLLEEADKYSSRLIISWGKQKLIKLEKEAQHFTFLIILKQLMGLSMEEELTSLVMTQYDVILEGILTVPTKLLPKYSNSLKAREKVVRRLAELVDGRRQERDPSSHGDLLGEILKEGVEEGSPLPTNQIVDLLVFILFAGYETSSRAITGAVKFLTDHPKALLALKVINETLRLINLAVGSFREAIEDVHIKGHTIPKGWKVFLTSRVAHLDESNYSNPYMFDPWRWEGTSLLSQESFAPFGWGRRYCPGSELARLEISFFLHHLVTKYKWEQAKEDTITYFPVPNTKYGLPLNVKALE